jgi:hypothetical protein
VVFGVGADRLMRRSVAQLVEHRSPKPGVGGSIPSGPVGGSAISYLVISYQSAAMVAKLDDGRLSLV